MADSFDVAAKLEAYRGELGAQVNAICEKSPFEDYRQPYLDEAAVSGDDAFPSSLLPRLASLVQGRAEPLALVATEAQAELGEGAPSVDVVSAKILSIAERKPYGVKRPKKAVVVTDDESQIHAWCWEVSALEAYFPAEAVRFIKAARQARISEGKLIKALQKFVNVLIKGDAKKAAAEEKTFMQAKRTCVNVGDRVKTSRDGDGEVVSISANYQIQVKLDAGVKTPRGVVQEKFYYRNDLQLISAAAAPVMQPGGAGVVAETAPAPAPAGALNDEEEDIRRALALSKEEELQRALALSAAETATPAPAGALNNDGYRSDDERMQEALRASTTVIVDVHDNEDDEEDEPMPGQDDSD